jgi:hypothetical protein
MMSRAEFLSKFPNASEDTVRANCVEYLKPIAHASTPHPHNPKPRKRNPIQEPQAHGQARPEDHHVHRAKSRSPDAGDNRRFRVTANFRFSDRRRRDLDGCTATVMDCLVNARRRLLDMCAG